MTGEGRSETYASRSASKTGWPKPKPTMDSTIARLFARAARKAMQRDAPAPKPKKSRREETGKTFRMASRAVPRHALCKIKAIMDGLIGEAEATSNPFDASWQSINGGGFDGTWGGEYMASPDCTSLHL